MEYIALALGLVGILMAWSANRKNKELNERLSQTNSRIYTLRRDMQEKQEKAEQEAVSLRVELLKLKGDLKITPQTRVGELPFIHPQAQQLLAAFHLGGCASCSIDDQQTLAEAAAANGRDLEPILLALNTLVTENGASHNDTGRIAPERLRAPNVQLYF